jgi:hypothetical protein
VKEHIEKHRKYSQLEERKKIALAEYKECKEQQKQIQIKSIRQEDEEKKK